ncbi:sensor histidine kinase [Cohnella sp.]|uniref:sensor histidine kinase n=1 Tax=Cohnella sp. TaxID=1883426 RepID=UPI003562F57B
MQDFLHFLKLDLLVAQPQTFITLLFCFSFLDPLPKKIIKRLILFTLVHSIYTDTLVLLLPLPFHIVNSIFFGTLLMFVIFRELTLKVKVFMLLFWLLLGLISDIISSAIIVYLMGISSHYDIVRETPVLIKTLYPQLLIMVIASWLIRNRNLFSAKRFFAFILEDNRKSLMQVIILISIQFCLLGVLQFLQITYDSSRLINAILVYLTILVSLLALVSIIRLLVRTREQAAKSTQEVYIDDINDMFTSIRGQRHDFLNHVQVIHTMVQMGRTEQLKAYVGDLVKETRDVSDIVHHSSPALAAFIQAKTAVSIGKGIDFTYELPDKWDAGETTVKVIDIIKIMGNLVDNAFDEAMNLPQQERSVFASIRALEDGSIELQVSNRGRSLTAHDRQLIFKPGYTTKGEGHSGLGLAIVQERVKHYKGSLDLVSDEREGLTTFKVYLPEISA